MFKKLLAPHQIRKMPKPVPQTINASILPPPHPIRAISKYTRHFSERGFLTHKNGKAGYIFDNLTRYIKKIWKFHTWKMPQECCTLEFFIKYGTIISNAYKMLFIHNTMSISIRMINITSIVDNHGICRNHGPIRNACSNERERDLSDQSFPIRIDSYK